MKHGGTLRRRRDDITVILPGMWKNVDACHVVHTHAYTHVGTQLWNLKPKSRNMFYQMEWVFG